jgi:hypothetical protein
VADETVHRALITILVLTFLAYSTIGIADPPGDGHDGYVLGEKAHFAINYLKFGYLGGRMGQKMYTGWSLEEGGPYEYYVHHPILVSVMVSLSFLAFGACEWAARIVPVLFNLCAILFLYAYVREYWGRRTALYSVFFMVFTPMTFYARSFVSWEVTSVACINLTLLAYVLWLKSKIRLRYLLLTVLAGSFSDWQYYFIAPAILAHYIIFVRGRRGWRILYVAPVTLAGFGLFLTHVYILTGSFTGKDDNTLGPSNLANQLLFRMNRYDAWNIKEFTYPKLYEILKGNFEKYYTRLQEYSVALLAAGILTKAALRRKLEAVENDALPLLLFASYAGFLFIFGQYSWIHDFEIISLLPAVPVVSAVALSYLTGTMDAAAEKAASIMGRKPSPAVLGLPGAVLALAAMCLFVQEAYPAYGRIVDGARPSDIVRFLSTVKGENLLVNFGEGPYFQFRFYTDQVKVKQVNGYAQFREIADSKGNATYGYFIEKGTSPISDAKLKEYLQVNYRQVEVRETGDRNYTVYDLKARKSWID